MSILTFRYVSDPEPALKCTLNWNKVWAYSQVRLTAANSEGQEQTISSFHKTGNGQTCLTIRLKDVNLKPGKEYKLRLYGDFFGNANPSECIALDLENDAFLYPYQAIGTAKLIRHTKDGWCRFQLTLNGSLPEGELLISRSARESAVTVPIPWRIPAGGISFWMQMSKPEDLTFKGKSAQVDSRITIDTAGAIAK
ncbi:MAG: hypothetical protein LBR73_10060 [Oscillospiraceae bacterium]|jgi:hypothetical protein|nr:hypothetical protein [Oscillospiraceae bacterium]